MHTSHQSPSPVTAVSQGGILPDELLAANHRVAARRARSSRALLRARTRRRVIPTVVAMSVAMVGAGVADAYVNRTVPQPTSTTTPTASNATAQNAANARSLAQVARALKADQRALAALMAGARQIRSHGSAAAPSSSSIAAPAAPSASAPVATPAPAPAPAPATHTTTGASSVAAG